MAIVLAMLLSGMTTGIVSVFGSAREVGSPVTEDQGTVSDLPLAGEYKPTVFKTPETDPLVMLKPIKAATGSNIPEITPAEKAKMLEMMRQSKSGNALSAPNGGITPNDKPGALVHGGATAWGITKGAGSNIAIVDSGIDYGHDDLSGNMTVYFESWPKVTDTASPYYGWPISYDATAQGFYLKLGYPLGTNPSANEFYSSYANMMYRQIVTKDTGGTSAKDYWGNSIAALNDIPFFLTPGDNFANPNDGYNSFRVPKILALYPTNNSNNVPNLTKLVIMFSEPMDSASFEGAITWTPATLNPVYTWSPDFTYVSIQNQSGTWPAGAITYNINQKLVFDMGSNPLGKWKDPKTFTTVASDSTAPTLAWVNPPSGSSNLVNTTSFVVTFSEQMNKSSVESGITLGAYTLGFEWAENGTTVTVVPTTPLANQAHSLLLDNTKIKDLAGNLMSAPVPVAISCAADGTPPTVVSTTPGMFSLSFPYKLVLQFSEKMDQKTLDLTKIARGLHLFPNSHVDLTKDWDAKWNLAGTKLTLTPKTQFRYNSFYMSSFTIRVDDGSGKYLEYTNGNSLDGYPTLNDNPPYTLNKIDRLYAIDGILSGGKYNNTSAAYRLGVHKDLNLQATWNERPGMLLTANSTGAYTDLYVDLNDDQMFNDETPVTKSKPISKVDLDGDEYPDFDSGLLYWISDGKNLPPYATTMAKRINATLPAIPAAGALVLMAGEFAGAGYDADYGHGTEVAVNAAGRGFSDRITGGDLLGLAPDASLIQTGSFQFSLTVDSVFKLNNTPSMFYFPAEGYDGLPGTGDEAQVATVSATSPSGLSGLSFYSRLIDYAANDVGKGKTLFVTGAGDSGPGYGTISAFGGASSALTVGDSFHQYYRLTPPYYTNDQGGNLQSGYANIFTSSRGPTASGQPKPDVLAAGTYSWVARPLSEGSGMWGFNLVGGSGISAGLGAGAAALVYAGWNKSVLPSPTAWQVKSIIMSSAKDLHADPLTQGAGLLDAGLATQMANMTKVGGINAYLPGPAGSFPTSSWVGGEFRGNASNSFLKFIEPGKAYKQQIDIQNMGNSSQFVEFFGGVYNKAGEWTYNYRRATAGADTFILNASGIYLSTGGSPLKSWGSSSSLWKNSEQALITVYYDGTLTASRGARIDTFYWNDKNGNNAYDGTLERNRQTVVNLASNIVQVSIPKPITTQGPKGLAMLLQSIPNDLRVYIKVEFFDKLGGIISLDKQNMTLGAGKTGSFNATIDVPFDAGTGTYEFLIWTKSNGKESIIPVLVTVMTKGTKGSFAGGPIENSAMYGPTLASYGSKTYYYFETPYDIIQRPATRGILDIEATYAGTGGDMKHYIEAAADEMSKKNMAKYGTFTMTETDKAAPGTFGKTTGGIAKAFTITGGVNLLEVTYSALSGKDTYETTTGEIGTFELAPVSNDLANPEIYIDTNQASGFTPVYTRSTVTWNGIAGTATATLSNTSSNRPIWFNDFSKNGSGTFVEYLAKSGTKLYDNITSDVVIVSWHMIGTGTNKDSDLGVFLDANLDYIPQASEFVKYDADSDSDEKVELVVPAVGMYIICLAGYDFGGSKTPSTYNWENKKTVISSTATIYPTSMPTGQIKPNEKGNFLVAWKDIVTEGVNKGAFYLSTGDAPLAFMLLVPITLRFDVTSMAILNPTPLDGSTVNTDRPSFTVQIASPDSVVQLDDTKTKLFVDGIDITGDGKVNRDYKSGNPEVYYPGGIVVQLKSITLAEGEHMAKVIAYDWSGNVATFTWRFFVHSTVPGLMVTTPVEDRTIAKCSGAYLINGIAPGATRVTIYAADTGDAVLYQNGEFSRTVQVTANSENLVRIEAVDAVGNKAIVTKTIVCDTTAPPIEYVSPTQSLTSDGTVQVSFKITVANEPGTYSVLVNGAAAAVLSDGTGIATVTLSEGTNTITLTSLDQVGNTVTATSSVIKDSTPPVLLLTLDLPAVTDQQYVRVKGEVNDLLSNFTLTVNGVVLGRCEAGSLYEFTQDVQLYSWSNTIVITATDKAGNSVSVVKSVGYVIKGTNYGYILGALAVVLAVLGAIIGFLLGKGAPPPPPEEEKKEEAPAPTEEKKEAEETPPPPPPEEETPPPPPEETVSVEQSSEGDVIKPE